jgi:hypothetical protein
VDINAAFGRKGEDVLWKDLPVRRDDNQIRLPGLQLFHNPGFAQRKRLENWYPQLIGHLPDWRRRGLAPAAGGSVWLGYNANHPRGFVQFFQRGEGEIGRTHKDNAGIHA